MLDFTAVPVIDDHSHPLNTSRATLTPERLSREFYHGQSDLTPAVGSGGAWDASEGVWQQLTQMGVVQAMACQLSKVLDCAPDLATVTAERNRRTAASFPDYIRLLYADAGIVGTVVDSALNPNDPELKLIPGRIMRLFQMGPVMQDVLKGADSYRQLLVGYQERLDRGIRQDGFVGVKTHLGEEVGFGVEPVSDAEAESVFAAAKAGDSAAYKRLYVAIFCATLLQCQELGVPVHVHTGITGGLWNGPIANTDPFLLVPLIRRPEYIKTRIVLLHGAYPWIQHAATVAHSLPHVWVDLSWTTPWISLRLVECYRELIAMAPLSKVMIGSGGHGTPEIAWLAAKTAKIALRESLGDAVRLELLAEKRAAEIGRMILHDNAARLYGLG